MQRYACPVRWLLAVLVVVAPTLSAQEQRATEQITVERILIDARVTEMDGDPILGLTPADFEVKVDGKPAVIESVLWIPETVAARIAAGMDEEDPEVEEKRGRLFIYFVQTDFAREPSRLGGQLKFLPYAQKMIEDLEPGDRVAVFSFDSHMKFHLDFSDDKSEIEFALRKTVLTSEPHWPRPTYSPSLAGKLDKQQMLDCTKPEVAFIHVANAVRNIPGPKTMVLFGWGLGHFHGGRVYMDNKYPIARYALESSRVSVFSLDMSIADYHSLEAGLQKTAADTGGFYAKTHIFPQSAVNRLQKTLSGHYELEVRKPAGLPLGQHELEVNVKRRNVHVLSRTSYVDRP